MRYVEVGKGNDGPVQPRACTFLLLFPASCPVSLVLFFQESMKINRLYIIVFYFSANQKVFERGGYAERELTI
jgi:hypothetical protein